MTRRRILIVLAACLPLVLIGWVGLLLTQSSPEGPRTATSPNDTAADAQTVAPLDTTAGSETPAPPTPVWDYAPPPTRGSLAGSRDVLAAAEQRAREHFDDFEADPHPPRADEVAVLFAGDAGPHRVIVAVAPASSTPDLLWRVALVGPAGAPVDQLAQFGNGNDFVGSDEHAVAVGDVSGTVTVVTYPPATGPVQVGAVPVSADSLVWQPAVDHGGWATAELTGFYPIFLVDHGGGVCSTALVGYTGEDQPIDQVAIDAAIQAGCTAGMA